VDTTELTSKLDRISLPQNVSSSLRRRINALDKDTKDAERLKRALGLPWCTAPAERVSLTNLRSSLNSKLFVPENISDLLIDHLVVRDLQIEAGPMAMGQRRLLCITGPPGVGKSRISHHIAETLHLPIKNISLDHLTSAEEFYGSNEKPGALMEAIEHLDQAEVVLVLEGIDSFCSRMHSPPLAMINALTNITSLNQFTDPFFDVPFDVSRVLFIATANWMPDIPASMHDSLDVVELDGYIDDDKITIAKEALLPEILGEYKLASDEVQIDHDALGALVRSYTSEPGVRALGEIVRRIVRRALSNRALRGSTESLSIGIDDLAATIGRPPQLGLRTQRRDLPGLAAGAVVRRTGGILGQIEAVQMPGSGRIRILDTEGVDLTSQYAVVPSFVRSRLSELGVSARSLEEFDTDLLLPASELPGDEDSLAIASAITIVSLMRDKPVDTEIVAIGGMTVHGRVRRADGVRPKILAAHRAGIRRVLLPRQNEHDLASIPSRLHDSITFIPIDNAGQAINIALR